MEFPSNSNEFGQFFKAVVRIWTMFHCFRRKHYDKAPLVWISNIGYWSHHYPELYQTFENNVASTDEYPVENAHSIIRANSQSADDCETISNKAKMIFTSKTEIKNFKSVFTPPKSFAFARSALKSLKVKAAGNYLQYPEVDDECRECYKIINKPAAKLQQHQMPTFGFSYQQLSLQIHLFAVTCQLTHIRVMTVH